MTPIMSEKGLYQKFIVQHADGSPTDPKAKYFVLRYDRWSDQAARSALRQFATRCEEPLRSQLGKAIYDAYWDAYEKEQKDPSKEGLVIE